MAGIDVRHLGDFIREQRDLNNISLRQLSRLAGVSNPYLSQIERGLRKPSAEILQQIAKALRISAEALYVQAGILEHREGSGQVAAAVLADEGLSERQKQVLLEIYDSFRKENGAGTASADGDDVAVSVVTAHEHPVDADAVPTPADAARTSAADAPEAAAAGGVTAERPAAGRPRRRATAPTGRRRASRTAAAPSSDGAVVGGTVPGATGLSTADLSTTELGTPDPSPTGPGTTGRTAPDEISTGSA